MDLHALSSPAAMFGGMAIFGVITASWQYIKGFVLRLTGLMIVRIELDTELVACMNYYAWAKLRKTPTGFGSFGAGSYFVQPVERMQQVAHENIGSKSMLFWKNWRPLLMGFTYSKDQPNHGNVTFIRGMFNAEKLVVEAVDAYNQVMKGTDDRPRFRVVRCQGAGARSGRGGGSPSDSESSRARHPNAENTVTPSVRFLKWSFDQLGQKSEGKEALNRMALSPECEEASQEAQRWVMSEKWYKERQIPWRRGWLLHGPPGTGKTSFVRSLAQELNVPVYSFDLGTMSNSEFNGFWRDVRQNTPAIVLIEDIDGVFNKRENILGENGGGLSFDCLLNGISGVDNSDGIFVIITTNKIECIDEALGLPKDDGMSTRPGRLDRVLKLEAPSAEGRRKLARRILAGESEEMIEQLVAQGAGDTGAQFQERCSRLALVSYWERRNAAPLSIKDVK